MNEDESSIHDSNSIQKSAGKSRSIAKASLALLLALVASFALLVVEFVQLRKVSNDLTASQWNYSRLQSMMVTVNGQTAFLQDQVKNMKSALKQAVLVVLLGDDPTCYHEPDCVKLDNASYPYRFLSLQEAAKLGFKPDPACQ